MCEYFRLAESSSPLSLSRVTATVERSEEGIRHVRHLLVAEYNDTVIPAWRDTVVNSSRSVIFEAAALRSLTHLIRWLAM